MDDKRQNCVGAALVVGGGVAGMQAALDLAESGIKVHLVERKSAIGGHMAQLDKTFPTNDCAMCILSPRLVECGRHRNIQILTNAEVIKIEGEAGDFVITVKRRARSVDMDRCTGCGQCVQRCPLNVPNEWDLGLGSRKAIYFLFPQGVPNVPVIDREHCFVFTRGRMRCRACERACPAQAINYDEKDRFEELRVGAVILAPGFEPYPAELSEEYGLGRYANVLTSLQFERLLSASGCTYGHVVRPSDQQEPRKVAFLQCIGSRDQKHDYCSSVCCMYAAKEAMLAKEHLKGVDCHIFHMDVRAFGKGFDAYYERAKVQGVQYTRCRISGLREVPASKNLLVRYQAEDGEMQEEEFDLVVLSVGLEPPRGAKELARAAGIQLDERGFCLTDPLHPLETGRKGVFACGTFVGPKDIPDTVVEASGAAARVLQLLSPVRGTQVTEKEYPPEVAWDLSEPRVGVFVCSCGNNIAGVVNVREVTEYAQGLPGVVHAENTIYACSADSLKLIQERVAQYNLNRVVVASCTPRTHEPLFQDTIRDSGLNPFLFEMANIREQCSWVHSQQPQEATQKSKTLVRMAVARARWLQAVHKVSLGLNHSALVIGGGVAGMRAALDLAGQGFQVYLVERSSALGGWGRQIASLVEGTEPQAYVDSLIRAVEENERIEVLLGMEVVDTKGFVGNFRTTVTRVDAPIQRLIEHGVTIVATGAQEHRGAYYLLGQDARVLTIGDLEQRLAQAPEAVAQARNVGMILCVGPNEDGSCSYCSRICCTVAIKNAIRIKELNPQCNVYLFYKDIRTYGFHEKVYTQAREKGVFFVRYEDARPPQVNKVDGRLRLTAKEPILGDELELDLDTLVLATALVPSQRVEALSRALKVPLTAEGFFLEAHIKLRPIDFATEGVFLCGAAHYPKFIGESLVQASAAAARASTILAKAELEVGGVIAQVTPEKCAACLTCVRVCPYDVPFINQDGVAQIEVAQCQGCGICVAECPAKAIELLHYHDRQLIAKIDAMLEEPALGRGRGGRGIP